MSTPEMSSPKPSRAVAVGLLLLGLLLASSGLGVVFLMALATTVEDFSWDEAYVPIMYSTSAASLVIALIGVFLIRGARRRLRGARRSGRHSGANEASDSVGGKGEHAH